MRAPPVRVFLLGAVSLFLQAALLRWLPSEAPAFSYFKNIVLIASFLGLGVGFLRASAGPAADAGAGAGAPAAPTRRALARFAGVGLPIAIVVLVLAVSIVRRWAVSGRDNIDEHLWLLYTDLPRDAPTASLSVVVPIFYALIALVFAPIGHATARAMTMVRDPLLATCLSSAGGAVGTVVFAGLSFLETSPPLWFAVPLGLWIALFPRVPAVAGAAAVLAGLLLARGAPDVIWSPYYAIRFMPVTAGRLNEPPGAETPRTPPAYTITVNRSFHQSLFDFDARVRNARPDWAAFFRAYSRPYDEYASRHGRPPSRVLVVGAGAGNDVDVALRSGAQHIDAVEIDPVILRLGAERHPSRVYADSRVTSYQGDARAFLQRAADRAYDLIVFGTLDSQIALSALSTVRLDNFVYTVESFAQARRALAADGLLAVFFWSEHDWIRLRLVETMTAAFHKPPEIYERTAPGLFNTVLLATAPPTDEAHAPSVAVRDRLRRDVGPVAPATDDWPFLYLRRPAVSSFYLSTLGAIAFMSLCAIAAAGRARADHTSWRLRAALFFQGLAFLLIEARTATGWSLLFGSTWLVSAGAAVAVLGVLAAANLVVRRWRIDSLAWPLAAAACILGLNAWVGSAPLLAAPTLARAAGAVALHLSPIFCASVMFSTLVRHSPNLGAALGVNLVGGVAGGLVEYAAMVTGVRALNAIALLALVLVWLAGRRTAA